MKTKLLLISLLSVLILTGCSTAAENAVEADQAKDTVEVTEEATVLTLDTENSEVNWYGEKITGNNHSGNMDVFSGEIYLNAKGELEGGNFEIDMDSMTESKDNQGVLKHLKSPDFFDVEKYPTATFEITNVTETDAEGATHTIEGNLTMKGITKNISFDATINEIDGVYFASTQFEIDRTDWDVRFGSGKFFDDLGDGAIKDAIQFEINLQTS